MAHPRIGHRVRKFMEDHPGSTVYRDDILGYIQQVTGRRPTDGAIAPAIKKLIEEGMRIQVLDAGNSWRFQPNGVVPIKAPERELFERVYITKNDHWILEDSHGEVTIVKPVDL